MARISKGKYQYLRSLYREFKLFPEWEKLRGEFIACPPIWTSTIAKILPDGTVQEYRHAEAFDTEVMVTEFGNLVAKDMGHYISRGLLNGQ